MKKIRYLFVIIVLCLFIGKVNAYDYKTGDVVSYNNIKFYVISNNDESLTLIKAGRLLKTDVNYEELGIYQNPNQKMAEENFYNESKYLYIPYYNSETCYNTSDECTTNYDDSILKRAVDYWVDNNINDSDLIEDSNGYKARVITSGELIEKFGYTVSEINAEKSLVIDKPYPFFKSIDTWVFDGLDSDNEFLCLTYFGAVLKQFYNYNTVNPVINIKSDKVKLINKDDNAYEIDNKAYKLGDVISFKGQEFYVLRDSKEDSESITLIKKEPMSYDDICKYIEGYKGKSSGEYISKMISDPGPNVIIEKMNSSYGAIRYCDRNSDVGCINDYNKSPIKYVIDNWSNDLFGDSYLIKDNYGYTSRLLNKDDLLDYLHYENGKMIKNISQEESIIEFTGNTIDFGLYGCWTMIPVGDSINEVYVQNDPNFKIQNLNGTATICPVVTIRKIPIDKPTNVLVPDTFVKKTLIFIAVGFSILIITTILVLVVFRKGNTSKNNK